jgi:RNA recognition motif-containing protein
VGGLSRKTREEDIEKAFEKFGKIRSISFKQKYVFIVSILSIIIIRNMMITMLPEMQWIEWMADHLMVKSLLLSQLVRFII